ncbi:MAG TPA: metal ABC transporter permease [Desulfatiglandales bacterium]|nr:metal ABC transporter permease [Desulfatiglandales bacterium]
MIEVLHLEFVRNALLAGFLASIMCGIIGTLVVVNRIVFISGGIAHASYGGIGLAFFLGFSYVWGILGFALLAALIMAAVSMKAKQRADTIIGVVWAVGMALGVILLDITPGYNVDLMSYLFGSILTVPTSDLWFMLILDGLVVLIVGYYYHDLVSLSYDEEFAQVRGIPVKFLYFLLIAMIALSVVMVIQVVGLILVIALLTIPPYIAEKYAESLSKMMLYSILLNFFFTSTGLLLSYHFNLTSGASIIMVSAICFFISFLVERLKPKRSA